MNISVKNKSSMIYYCSPLLPHNLQAKNIYSHEDSKSKKAFACTFCYITFTTKYRAHFHEKNHTAVIALGLSIHGLQRIFHDQGPRPHGARIRLDLCVSTD